MNDIHISYFMTTLFA